MKIVAELTVLSAGLAWAITRGAEEALRIHIQNQTASVKLKHHLLIDRLIGRPIEVLFLRLNL